MYIVWFKWRKLLCKLIKKQDIGIPMNTHHIPMCFLPLNRKKRL